MILKCEIDNVKNKLGTALNWLVKDCACNVYSLYRNYLNGNNNTKYTYSSLVIMIQSCNSYWSISQSHLIQCQSCKKKVEEEEEEEEEEEDEKKKKTCGLKNVDMSEKLMTSSGETQQHCYYTLPTLTIHIEFFIDM